MSYIHLVYGYVSTHLFAPLRDGNKSNNKGKFRAQWTKHANLEIDMFFDADKGTLNMCIVGNDVGNEIKIWDIVKRKYVPHVNTGIHDLEMRCAEIPTDWYGQSKEIDFQVF